MNPESSDAVYEDLDSIAQLKFTKELERISTRTRDAVRNLQNEFAAAASRSGHHEHAIGSVYIQGTEDLAFALFNIWVELITKRNRKITLRDVGFVADKVEKFLNSQRGNLSAAIQRRPSAVVNLLIQEADLRLAAAASRIRRELKIMALESEAFPSSRPTEGTNQVKEVRKKRYSVGRKVLVGMGRRPAVVTFVDDVPSVLGEFRHTVRLDGREESIDVLGCDIQPIPNLDEDLEMQRSSIVHVHINNSNVGNLNLGSQIGSINASLDVISESGKDGQAFANALKGFTEAVVAEPGLGNLEKKELIEALSEVAGQAANESQNRSTGVIKPILARIPKAIAVSANLTKLWEHFGPTISKHLGL